MKILTNKYFILGNLLLLLISIPITLFFISKQQELRGKAAPTSRLSFSPENPSTSTLCQSFNVDIMVDPGSNIVSIVDFYLKYDPTKLDVLQIKESSSFPTVVRPISIASGEANMSVSVGADVTQAIQTVSKVATITFRSKTTGSAQITFDQEKSRVFSLAPADQPTENVLFQVTPANITIGQGACPTANTTPTPNITGTTQPTGTQISPTTSTNIAPNCTSLSTSPSATGSAPLSVLFTARGNDPDTSGTLTKVVFNFGDGQTQDITSGLGQRTATIQANHTYQSGGTFQATAVFTDNAGGLSNACSQTITASGSAATTPTPTSSASSQITPTSAPTTAPASSEPTIAPTGDLAKTIGIIGAVILTIIGGIALITL